jgi:hypothetical protein
MKFYFGDKYVNVVGHIGKKEVTLLFNQRTFREFHFRVWSNGKQYRKEWKWG